ncbi:AAA family ATPase [Colwellia sp. 12G3]|uniref:AAA family ATPase n=1 Tax=Colwellia sp. 12G3 TaxID=2058299 RepID=UPI000C31E394|nr:AAA family ATPase [Colwellia sp. 12G3]PKI17100.1 hypothetical protein CXF71_07665 [Colwellia sp. 12G3]
MEAFLRKSAYFYDHKTEMKPLLDGFLYESESMFFYGASGSGKSLFVYSLAVEIAGDSGSFLGIDCATNKKVLYIDGEMHYNTICDRFDSLGCSDKLDYLSSTDMVANSTQPINLSQESDFEDLINLVVKNKYDLVVIDNVRTLFQLLDENNAESWRIVNDLIFRLRAAGASVIMVHHTTKEAYKSDGELTWAGSGNAVTVVDRTCGIYKIGEASFSLAKGDKEGRSGHSWNQAINEIAFNVGKEGLSIFDYSQSIIDQLETFLYWLRSHLNSNNRDKLQAMNRMLSLGVGKNLNRSSVWSTSQHMWETLDEQINFKSFVTLLSNGILPSESKDNQPVFEVTP